MARHPMSATSGPHQPAGARSLNRNQRSKSPQYSPASQLNHHTLPENTRRSGGPLLGASWGNPAPPSTLTCSEPVSLCYAEATNSATLKQPTSAGSLGRPPPATGRLGTLYKSSTASTWAEDHGRRPPPPRPTRLRRPLRHRRTPEFSKVVDTVIRWGDDILAWHHCGRPSNGRHEESPTGSTNAGKLCCPRTLLI